MSKDAISIMVVSRLYKRLHSTPTTLKKSKLHSLLYLSLIMIVCAADVESNPGPRSPKYPCQICHRAVTWKTKGVACDDCDKWYHAECMGMNTAVYEGLSNVSWHCTTCGMPQFTSSLFESFLKTNSYNSFSSLDDSDNLGHPSACSSPKATSAQAANTGTVKAWNNFTIININFQSIRNKKAEVGNIIESYNPSIIIGTETWLNPSIHSSEIFPPNYSVYRKDRADGFGGVLLAIRTDLTSDQIVMGSGTTESVYAKMTLGRQTTLIVGALYRPPRSTMEHLDEMCNQLESLATKYKKAALWLGGDLNLPDIQWKTQTVIGNANSSAINQRFLHCLQHCGLDQLVDFPTRQDTTLDLFLTNRPSLVNKCTAAPGVADHDMVLITTSATAKRNKPIQHKIYLWKKADTENMKDKLQKFRDKFLQDFNINSPVEEIWSSIKTNLLGIQEECVPSKTSSKRYSQPWVNTDVKRMTRRKNKSYRKARKTGKSKDKARYQHLKQEAKKTCQRAYDDYIRNMISPEATSNPKRFWSFIKSKKTDSSGVASLKDSQGIQHSDSSKKADILNTQFSSVFNKGESTDNIPPKGPSPHDTMSNINITAEGVKKLLHQLNPHKATGPDNVSCRLLKEQADEITPVIQLLYQASISQGNIPLDWKTAHVVPIFKKGDKSKAENYRPVSLTSVVCKLMEHILCSNISKHLDEKKILNDAQHGFRKRRSCESQLILTVQDLATNIDSSGQTDVILLDFSKAFDKVPHERLLYKLNYYGIRGENLKWIKDFLGGRTQLVLLEGTKSETAPVQSGVPQGSVLGPLLFLLFINDLPDYVSEKSTVRLFADDCALYRTIKDKDDAIKLQEDLDELQRWENEWLMEFHPQKCQILHFTNKRKVVDMPYNIHGHVLEVVDTAKYLGIHLHKGLKWNHHIGEVTKKANSTIAFLRRNLHQCPPETKALCYQTLVRPSLEYGCSIWDPYTQENINKLELVQRRAARMVYRDYRTTSSVTNMLNQLHWPPLQERRGQARALMMYRIVYNLIDIPPVLLVPTISSRGNSMTYFVPFARTQTYQKSFFPDGIRIWNSLPTSVVNSPTIDIFKQKMSQHTVRP